MGPITNPASFQIAQGEKRFAVHAKRADEASSIDLNKDNTLDNQEIFDYLRSSGDLPDLEMNPDGSFPKVLDEFKTHLRGEVSANKSAYQNYEEITQDLTALAEKYPDKAQKVSLGKTHEGRDIWALRVSSNISDPKTAEKPAVVITGVHHAREWATSQVPGSIAKETLANYGKDPAATARVDNGELWFVPVVNPDGFEYSRNEDSWWRKNRRPVTETPCGPVKGDVRGVDLNRNYSDGKAEHAHIWRPVGDDPCSTRDDGRATSDDPRKDTYRGPSGASESEVQSLLKLELDRGNVKGVLDFHSYGGMILYPWGASREKVENVETYQRVGNAMNGAIGDKYRVFQSVNLYPTSGGSHDVHHANGVFSITAEIGESFHPSEAELGPVVEQGKRLGTSFIDQVLAEKGALLS